jgi:hypothetical protein
MASGRVSKVKGKVLNIPNPPTIGTATAGGESVSIAFTADSSGKGGPTRSYIAKSNPGNITATGSTSPISVTGLTAGTSYTISVAGVNETGTSEYSSASGSAVPTVATAYESISTVTVGSTSQASISFTSIPATFKHLQIRGIARKDGSQTGAPGMSITFNDDTNDNYTVHYFQTDAGTITAYSTGALRANMNAMYFAGGGQTANVFAPMIHDVFDYANTNKYKTMRSFSGPSSNVNAADLDYIILGSGAWHSTSAITKITITGNNFVQYSHFALYGIRGE